MGLVGGALWAGGTAWKRCVHLREHSAFWEQRVSCHLNIGPMECVARWLEILVGWGLVHTCRGPGLGATICHLSSSKRSRAGTAERHRSHRALGTVSSPWSSLLLSTPAFQALDRRSRLCFITSASAKEASDIPEPCQVLQTLPTCTPWGNKRGLPPPAWAPESEALSFTSQDASANNSSCLPGMVPTSTFHVPMG